MLEWRAEGENQETALSTHIDDSGNGNSCYSNDDDGSDANDDSWSDDGDSGDDSGSDGSGDYSNNDNDNGGSRDKDGGGSGNDDSERFCGSDNNNYEVMMVVRGKEGRHIILFVAFKLNSFLRIKNTPH